ncbi:hypothetical protein GJV26_00415 [Massilia dura]|uniref:Uncharacterized protein n=1 Tax=Pseudoduganella dura TaxID=321982 RepID=A0A6I3XBV0_9BURK|nr:hypothetical protein [Pseudoduganella dura]MUI10961.1 hypothetical protein [Pseudoduganella dura]GGY13234.1 hypothetical protein GCM10007386_49480 [Pseudoduganella dura]
MESRYGFIREYLHGFALVQAEWEYLDLCLHIAGAGLPDAEYGALDKFRHRLEDIRLSTVRHHHDLTDAMLDLGKVDVSLLQWLAHLQGMLAQGAVDIEPRNGGRLDALMGTDFIGALENRAEQYEQLARDLLARSKRFGSGDGPRRLRGIVAGPSIYGKAKGGEGPKGQGKPDTPPKPNP